MEHRPMHLNKRHHAAFWASTERPLVQCRAVSRYIKEKPVEWSIHPAQQKSKRRRENDIRSDEKEYAMKAFIFERNHRNS
jgi:hypothetical protein